MKVKHKNIKESFRLLLSLGSAYDGDPFSLVFTSNRLMQQTYTCSYDGTTYTNCEMADNTHVLCTLDDTGLPCGLLAVSITVELEENKNSDGTYTVGDTRLVEALDEDGTAFHIELTNGASDVLNTSEMVWTLLGTVLHGEPGADGLTTKVKVNGTTYEQVDGLIDLGTIGGGTSGVPEAPADGKTYARKDAAWTEVTSMTADEKTKLAGIEAGAEVNVQADWNETDSSKDNYIQNKPTIPSSPSDIGAAAASHTHTKSEITDLPSIPSTASEISTDEGISESKNVQADLNQIAQNLNKVKGTNSSALSGDDNDTVEGGMRYNIHLTADAPSLSINTINDSEYESIIYLTIDSDAEEAEVSLPTTYKAIGDIPSFEAGKSYEISILKSIIVCGEISETDTTTEEEE